VQRHLRVPRPPPLLLLVAHRYLLAKTYFDLGEFQRCAFVLSPSDSFFPVASNGGGVPSPRPNTGPNTGAALLLVKKRNPERLIPDRIFGAATQGSTS
jgi:hypothetical protein